MTRARTFTRISMHCAESGQLNLTAKQCLLLYKEVYIMAEYLEDKDTMMLVCNQLALLFKKLQLYNEALHYQKLHLSFATETKNKAAQAEAFHNLGKVYVLVQKYQDAIECYGKAKDIAMEIGDKNVEGVSCGNMGSLYHMLGRHSDAINSFKQSLSVALETRNTLYQKNLYYNMASAYLAMENLPQVVHCYTEWLKFSTAADDHRKADVYESLGIAYQALGNFEQGIKYLEMMLEMAKKLQDPRTAQDAYGRIGYLYFSHGKFPEAIEYYRKKLDLASRLHDKDTEAEASHDLSMVYESQGNYAMAIQLNERAIAIAVAAGNESIEALAIGSLGSVYQKQGEYHKAIKYHGRSAQIFTNLNSEKGQARAYNNLGVAYKSLGNFYEAIKYYTKSLELCAKIGDKMGEENAHGNLGTAYELLGQYNEAITHAKKCQEIARQIPDKSAEGRAAGNIGTCLMKLGKSEEAVRYFEECLNIAREVKDRQNEGTAFGYLGKCKTNLEQHKEAIEMLDKQIAIAEGIVDKDQLATAYCNKGEAYRLLNDHEQAIAYFEKSLGFAKETENKNVEASSYRSLGRLYGTLPLLNEGNHGEPEKREQCFAKSIHYLKESLRCSEWQFDHLQEQDHLKISILDTFIKEYNFLTAVLLFNKRYEEALLVSERGRARALNDLLVSKYNINRDNDSAREPISFDAIENTASGSPVLFYSLLSSLQMCIAAWVIGSGDSSSNSTLLLEIDKAGISDMIDSTYSALNVREIRCEDRSAPSEDIQEQQHHSLEKSDTLDQTEKLLLSSCEKLLKRCIPDEDMYDKDNPDPLESLSKVLISPMQHLLTQDEIVVIPDGDLFTVPFAALRDTSTGKFLSETKRIRLAPSITSLKAIQECPEDYHCKKGALIIGNPKVGEVMFRGKRKDIHDLPCAEEEAKMIGHLLDVQPLIGSQATKEAIKQHLQEGVAVIHFAAHGTTDGEIFLTPTTNCHGDLPSEEDYILTMKEVQESGVRPQLVILSCCHSGRGEIKAEGVVGMSRAFLAAGARAVVASLWAIADEATMVFMEQFYTYLNQGESASKSLQQAMNDMRETTRYSDEQFWAPFFLIGDDVTLKSLHSVTHNDGTKSAA